MQYHHHHHHSELNELLHERATATLPKYSLVVDTPLPELDFYAVLYGCTVIQHNAAMRVLNYMYKKSQRNNKIIMRMESSSSRCRTRDAKDYYDESELN
jgi:hypothetical protein